MDTLNVVSKGPKPRLCTLYRSSPTSTYGFTLFQGFTGATYITSVQRSFPYSTAQQAGLRLGDKIIEVNSRCVEHCRLNEIDRLINSVEEKVELLVADPATVRYYDQLGYLLSSDMDNLERIESPKPPLGAFIIETSFEALSFDFSSSEVGETSSSSGTRSSSSGSPNSLTRRISSGIRRLFGGRW